MKKTAISLMAAMLVTISVQAQVKTQVLSDNHAMVRLESGSRYVLLPVEEKAENASVRVINKDNQTTNRPNVRLAVDNVDYYVPLEIKDGQLLDIIFHGDRRTKGSVKDFACWKEMKFSNSFDTECPQVMFSHSDP